MFKKISENLRNFRKENLGKIEKNSGKSVKLWENPFRKIYENFEKNWENLGKSGKL